MPKIKDITGNRYGNMVAKKFSHRDGGATYWECECDCGVTKVVRSGNLTSGSTESCGCCTKRKPAHERQNLIGQKFGNLFVINLDHIDVRRSSVWLCECGCGNKVLRTTTRLKRIAQDEGCNQCNTNKFMDKGEYFEGVTSNGESFFFDKDDIEKVMQFSWFMVKGYPTARKKKITLHTFLMGKAPKGYEYDHINRNPADDRRINLRLATRRENIANKIKSKGKTSKYKGVFWSKNKKSWVSTLTYEGKSFRLCCSSSEEECAKAYDKKSLELYGEFAVLNIIEAFE